MSTNFEKHRKAINEFGTGISKRQKDINKFIDKIRVDNVRQHDELNSIAFQTEIDGSN